MLIQILLTKLVLFSLLLSKNVEGTVECGPSGGKISMAGSTTVFPLAMLWAEKYMEKCPDIDIVVAEGGSGGGASRVCGVKNNDDGEPVDIGNMSRQWQDKEAFPTWYGYLYQCVDSEDDRSVIKIDVAIDGIALATSKNGTAASCIEILGGLTLNQLRWMFSNYDSEELIATGWDPNSLKSSDNDEKTHLWSELDPRCAPIEIIIAGAHVDTGTYEYFFESTCPDFGNGEKVGDNRPISYYSSTVGTDVLHYIEKNDASIAFFRSAVFSHVDIYHVPVQNHLGNYVIPTAETVSDGTYTPYSRRLYMNVLNDATSLMNTRPFFNFALSDIGAELVRETGFVPIEAIESELMLETIPRSGETIPIEPLSLLMSTKITETDADQSSSSSRMNNHENRSLLDLTLALAVIATLIL